MASSLDDMISEDAATGQQAQQQTGAPLSDFDKMIAQDAPPPPDYKNMGWGETAKNAALGFAYDVPSALWDTAAGLGHVLRHPLETDQQILNLTKGAVDYAKGRDTPEAKQAGNIWNNLTEENLKKYIAEKPAHAGIDLGMMLAVPEAGLEAAGLEKLATIPKVARYAVDPISQATGIARHGLPVASRGINEAIGHWGTGTGGEPLNIATEAGYEGGNKSAEFLRNINQTGDPVGILKYFDSAVSDYLKDRYNRYQSNSALVAQDKQQLSLGPAIKSYLDQEKEFSKNPAGGPGMAAMPNTLDAQTRPMRDAIGDALKNWQTRAALHQKYRIGPGVPNEFYTPSGLDLLKKNLNSLRDDPHLNTRPEAEVALNRVTDALRKEILDKSSHYGEWMKDYEEATKFNNLLRKELSLGQGNPATTVGKLMSSLRNNVAARNGLRGWITQKLLEKPGASEGMAGLSGQVLSSKWPRTLVNNFISKWGMPAGVAGAIGYLGVSPWAALPAAPFLLAGQSPYLMGRLSHFAGKVGRGAEAIPWRGLGYYGNASSNLPTDNEQ